MVRKNFGATGEPIGVAMSATKTIWLPVKQQCLFEFFINAQRRSQNACSSRRSMQQGDDTSANQNNMFILQDTHNDATGSLLVYATIDSLALDLLMNERDSSCVVVLPSGVAVVPDCCKNFRGG